MLRRRPMQEGGKMVDPRLYDSDTFVLLEPDQPEQFLSAAELLQKLEAILATRQADLSKDLQRFPTVQLQAKYLLESCCDFDVAPGHFMQWYAVRLEK
jgi:hypothetical protein